MALLENIMEKQRSVGANDLIFKGRIAMFDADEIKKWLGVVTASFAVIGGGWTAVEKTSFFKTPILTWSPEHFSITSGPANGEFKVIAAREKHRDDCSVEGFKLEVRDSALIMHLAKPSIAKFSGPATNKIDKFAYTMAIENPEKVTPGTATLMAHIDYKCPTGPVVINYPDHKNLTFEITKG